MKKIILLSTLLIFACAKDDNDNPLPECIPPTNLTINSVSSTEITVSWQESNETYWEYIIQPQGTGIPTTNGTVITTNPYTITGLDYETNYEIFMRTTCDVGVSSSWTGPANFTTSQEPNYSIEGKWIWSPSENRADTNTMYEFVHGMRYTYYCITCPGDDAYWYSLDESDRIPGSNPYTFENDTLRVDLHFGNELVTLVTFECDGGKLFMDGEFSHLWRLSSDCD